MENQISHEGIIEAIEGAHIRVRIVQQAACSGCKVAAHCNASEMKVKMIDVYNCHREGLKVGDNVKVGTSVKAAGKALLMGFGGPLILLLAVAGACLATGLSEGIAALSALGALVPYYVILWAFRNRIAGSIAFKLE
jgi:sigma-E factor negative regulatory protein RseC